MMYWGGGLLWLQASSAHTRFDTWDAFAEVVCSRFGREELQQLLIMQRNLMSSYITCWRIILLGTLYFFVTQFVDGLRSDVRSIVVLHRPQDLDIAIAFSCLQEEVLEMMRRDPRRADYAHSKHPGMHTPLPLPPPPGKGVPMAGNRSDDRRGMDGARATPFDDKLGALCAYR